MAIHAENPDQGPRVLVVEDHPVIAELVETRLRIEGLRASKCLGGREAIRRVDSEPFDLVILDIMMPDIDGYEVLAHIRGQEATRNLPVVFLTARSSQEDIEKGLRMGANQYVTKPFSGAELVRTVKILLQERQLQTDGHRGQGVGRS
jgi:two-component system OmpR family response regulator